MSGTSESSAPATTAASSPAVPTFEYAPPAPPDPPAPPTPPAPPAPPAPRAIPASPEPAPLPRPEPAPQNECDPNYAGACVPVASDVDCAGGSGNGPEYVRGPVRVVGTDIYGLDGNDNDGVGCE
ncbi:MAG: hypothetical protein ACRDRM_07170 [Pseudonocardiaceae bacterium]